MDYGCSFASSFDAVRQAQLAESLGFSYIGFFDSPALEPDVWITIANVVQNTRRITVGTAVLIPHFRHPMAQAAAIATIEGLAPGRLEVGIGTGFTGRRALGQRPLTWAYIRRFVTQVRGLLNGDAVEIDGAMNQMIHPPGYAPERPIRVPFVIAANGPKGVATARDVADGLIFGGSREQVPDGFPLLELRTGGIALEEGESPQSPRVLEAARVGFALQYHLAYDGFYNPPVPVESLPHGDDWLSEIARFPEPVRHLAVHDRHTVAVSAHDAAFCDRHPEAVAEWAAKAAVTPSQLNTQICALEAIGATRIGASGAARPNWERGLRAFADAAGL